MFMKKTLLASALAAIALGASAQTEVACPAGEFDFITKNLTADGSIIPYSIENGGYHDPEEAKFTIYDKSFNTVRSFTVTAPTFEYEYDVTVKEAKAPITKTTYDKYDTGKQDYVNYKPDENGMPTTIKTMDEWKEYVSEHYGKDMVVFTDTEGKFAFHENTNEWSSPSANEYQWDYVYWKEKNVMCAIKKVSYWYYTDNVIKNCIATMYYIIDTDNLNWETVGTKKAKDSRTGYILETHLRDYDANCAEEFHPYLTQGLFNKDDKFEIAVKAYRQGTGGDGDYNTSSTIAYPTSVTEDYAIYRTQEGSYDVESYISIINEDGTEVAALPDGSKDFEMFKVDGKLYMSVEVYKDGKDQTTIYGVDNVNTSITELARTTPVAAKKFFNTQGVQVNKNTKGIVIQKGGAKYWNK